MTTPEWLKRNSRGIDFGAPLVVLRETEHFALVKRRGYWAKLSAYGRSYIAVTYMLVAKDGRDQPMGWHRSLHYGRLSDAGWLELVQRLDLAENTDALPPYSAQPRQLITNHR